MYYHSLPTECEASAAPVRLLRGLLPLHGFLDHLGFAPYSISKSTIWSWLADDASISDVLKLGSEA